MDFFENVPQYPPDPIFGLTAEFKADSRKEKYTLITGYYRDEALQTPVLDAVASVEREMGERRLVREYLPIGGDAEFVDEVGKLAFGKHWGSEGIVGAQAVGGTGALFLVGAVAKNWTDVIGITDPTWVNHWAIFERLGMIPERIPYYRGGKLLFEEMVESLGRLPKGAVVLLHGSCHNPSGQDLTLEQWKALAEVIEKGELFPLIDLAYQGFSEGIDEDAMGLRLFVEKGLPLAVTYTCAKNFSIYSERAGAVFFSTGSKSAGEKVRSTLLKVIRAHYSNPPVHGAHIVKTILGDATRRAGWLEELAKMRKRMQGVRGQFHKEVSKRAPDRDWSALERGRGLFYFSEISKEGVAKMKEKGFYLAGDGRINLTGLNEAVLPRFVDAFIEAL